MTTVFFFGLTAYLPYLMALGARQLWATFRVELRLD